jgi:hypothetical protein
MIGPDPLAEGAGAGFAAGLAAGAAFGAAAKAAVPKITITINKAIFLIFSPPFYLNLFPLEEIMQEIRRHVLAAKTESDRRRQADRPDNHPDLRDKNLGTDAQLR